MKTSLDTAWTDSLRQALLGRLNPYRYLRPAPVASLISASIIAQYLYLLVSSHEVLVGFVPDDAFYELQIARHFLSTGMWSFDRGRTTTTGFHLLNVYLMSLFPGLLNHPWFAIKFWMGVGAVVSVGTVFVACRFSYRQFGRPGLIASLLVFTAPSFARSSSSLLEFPFVTLIAALYVSFLSPGGNLIGMFGLGVIGSLARSDFGGMPLALFVACAIVYVLDGRKDYLAPALTGLAGSSVGLGAVFIHNYLFSGHFLSGSAMAKALWASKLGYSLSGPAAILIMTTTESLSGIVLIIALGVVFAARIAYRPRWDTQHKFWALAGFLVVVVYLLTYGADGHVQPWYTADLVVPVLVLFAVVPRLTNCDAVLRSLGIAVVSIVAAINISTAYRPLWPYQRYMLETAEHLQRQADAGSIGGWNVGIIGYLLDGRVTNLDGLMNDQVYPFMRDGKTIQYIQKERIEYIVDFPVQIENLDLARMCGYNPATLAAHLRPLWVARSTERQTPWVDYTLFEVVDVPQTASRGR